jgi:peptide chain release factor 2
LKTYGSSSTIFRSASRWCGAIFDPESQRLRLTELDVKVNRPDLWSNPEEAQELLRQRKQAADSIEADETLQHRLGDFETYFHLAQEETDPQQREAVLSELGSELSKTHEYIAGLETQTLLAGDNDRLNAIMTIKPGAGGTESQDWAEMLLRMYMRWAEGRDFRTAVLDSTPGEEAGLKSATVRIEGENAYGLLSGESGVHRLVRISPFDQAARRHTSFASVFVIPEIDDRIEIVIKPDDIRIDTFRAGGAGGQHVNMTDSAVRITHYPSGIVVQCQNERSQHKNRELAMKVLKSRLYDHEMGKRQAEARKLDLSKPEISFGSQIRSYVLQPYQIIKDHRTRHERGDVQSVLNGDIDDFIRAYLLWRREPEKYAAAHAAEKELDI